MDLVPSDDGAVYFKNSRIRRWATPRPLAKIGEMVNIHGLVFSLNNPTLVSSTFMFPKTATTPSNLRLKAPSFGWADQYQGSVAADSIQLCNCAIVPAGRNGFVFLEPVVKGTYGLVKASYPETMGSDAWCWRLAWRGNQNCRTFRRKGLDPQTSNGRTFWPHRIGFTGPRSKELPLALC